jgi:hypothetical protein
LIPAGADTVAPDFADHLQNLFANAPTVSLEINMWPDYDHPQSIRGVPPIDRPGCTGS